MKDALGHGSNPIGAIASQVRALQARIASSGQAHVARIMQRHGIQGGPYKVQGLATNRAGQPWATQKAYRRRAVAERVAQGMRVDRQADLHRVKVR